MKQIITALAFWATVTLSTPCQAQGLVPEPSTPETYIEEQIKFILNLAYQTGFELYDLAQSSLKTGLADTWILTLQQNREYLIAAVCEEDCQDLDLTILNSQYQVLQENFADDPYPIVRVQLSQTEKVFIEATMVRCESLTQTCKYAILALVRSLNNEEQLP